jgi:GTPase SAR1 family protein
MVTQTAAMTFDLRLAAKLKSRAEQEIESILHIAESLGAAAAADLCSVALRELNEEQFRIVVVGEFSRGKSTFINALLGDRVLPAGIHPVTAILTRIRYEDLPGYALHYRSGHKQSISAEQFFNIVAPAEPDPTDEEALRQRALELDEFLKIESAEIGYPAALCQSGVQIVDTPGTNDINAAREQITYDFIPRADAILFMLSALDAIGESEIAFLRDRILKTDVQRIFFALNFADLLSTDLDRERVLHYVEAQLRSVIDRPRVFLLASKEALRLRRTKAPVAPDVLERTGLPTLERELATFLVEERTPIKLRKPVFGTLRACRSLKEEVLPVIFSGQDLAYADLQKKITALHPEIYQLQEQRDYAINQFRAGMEDRIPKLTKELRRQLEEIAEAAALAVRNYAGDLEKSALATAIERAVAPKETHLRESLNKLSQSAIEEEYGRAEETIKTATEAVFSNLFSDSDVHRKSLEGFGDAEAGEQFVAALKVGGGLAGFGVLGFIALPFFFLIPFALPFIGTIFKGFRESARSKTLTSIENDVRTAHTEQGRASLRAFDQRWAKLANELAAKLADETNSRIRDLEANMETLLHQASESEISRLEQRTRIAKLAADLKVSENELLRLSRWSASGQFGNV